MRTTVDIPDEIYRELKERAARQGTSVKQIILRSVVQFREEPESPAPRKRLKFPLIQSKRAGVLHLDNKMIYDLIDFP